jgi:hypothetical protein
MNDVDLVGSSEFRIGEARRGLQTRMNGLSLDSLRFQSVGDRRKTRNRLSKKSKEVRRFLMIGKVDESCNLEVEVLTIFALCYPIPLQCLMQQRIGDLLEMMEVLGVPPP